MRSVNMNHYHPISLLEHSAEMARFLRVQSGAKSFSCTRRNSGPENSVCCNNLAMFACYRKRSTSRGEVREFVNLLPCQTDKSFRLVSGWICAFELTHSETNDIRDIERIVGDGASDKLSKRPEIEPPIFWGRVIVVADGL